MAEYCNGFPPIKNVPGLTPCINGSQSQSILKLPLGYPETLLAEALQDSYQYTDADFALDQENWTLTAYAIAGTDPSGESVVVSTCSAEQVNPNGDGTYYTYYRTVVNLQGNRASSIEHAWLIYPLICDELSRGISKGPAALIVDDLSILPSPTVTPGIPALQVKVNDPWYNVLRCSRNNIIWAPPPGGTRCRSGKWTLQYSKPGSLPRIQWKCEGQPDEDSDYSDEGSFGSWPSSYECDGVRVELSLNYAYMAKEINYNMTVSELQDIARNYGGGAPFELRVVVTCTKYFPGGDLNVTIANPSPEPDEIRPDAFACFPEESRAKTIKIPVNAIDVAEGGEASRPFRALVDMGAQSCTQSVAYLPCCTNDSPNVGSTSIEFSGYFDQCSASVSGCTVHISCDDLSKAEQKYSGQLNVLIFNFVDSDLLNTISEITLGDCGDPIPPMSTLIKLQVSIEVTGGQYCACSDDSLSISLSASGVSAQFLDEAEIIIPAGIYDAGDSLFGGLFDVIITGDGKDSVCKGEVQATILGASTELHVNNNCECKPPPSSDSRDPSEQTCDGMKGIDPISVYYDESDDKCTIALGNVSGGGAAEGICALLAPGAGIAIDTNEEGKCEIRVTDDDGALAGIICGQLEEGDNIRITPESGGKCRINAIYEGIDICNYLEQGPGIEITTGGSGGRCQIVNTAPAVPVTQGPGISVGTGSNGEYVISNTAPGKTVTQGPGISVGTGSDGGYIISNIAMGKPVEGGEGIHVDSGGTAYVITNTAPYVPINITEGSGISVVSTSNGYIISNTAPAVPITQGSGISVVSGSNGYVINNTAMGKPVSAGNSGISVSDTADGYIIYNTAPGGSAGAIKVVAGNGYISVTSDTTTSSGVTIYRISLNTANVAMCE